MDLQSDSGLDLSLDSDANWRSDLASMTTDYESDFKYDSEIKLGFDVGADFGFGTGSRIRTDFVSNIDLNSTSIRSTIGI